VIHTAIRQLHLPHSRVHDEVHVYICTNCCCTSTSSQPAVTVEIDFVRKCCRKLTVMGYYWTLCLSDEPAFHLNGMMRHSCRISNSQPPKEITEYQMDTPKVNRVAPKITSPNTTGLFRLGLCEEYHLSGENCRLLNCVTLHNGGGCNNDQSYTCECVA
jgi:hypothetical protein